MYSHPNNKLSFGIDEVANNPKILEDLGRIGFVSNQSCCCSNGNSSVNVIYTSVNQCKGSVLQCAFGPQHGWFQCEQDNMIESKDTMLTVINTHNIEMEATIPLLSLYSSTREPLPEHLNCIDTLVVDLPDIGSRVYTYMNTLAGLLRACNRHERDDITVIVLDRPNPLGLSYIDDSGYWNRVEGNQLDVDHCSSFVGWYRLPMRHGLSLGELGHFFITEDKLTSVKYKVIPVKGLSRRTTIAHIAKHYTTGGFLFPFASPNMPTLASAIFFPAFVSLEATNNISEGRGTTAPFRVVGAPFISSQECLKFLKKQATLNGLKRHHTLKGITFHTHSFRPTFNKHKGSICNGLHFSPVFIKSEMETGSPNLFSLGIYFLYFCLLKHGDKFIWRRPDQGYEYNFTNNAIDLILGHTHWNSFFNNIHSGEYKDDKLEELLRWAHTDAIRFAEETTSIHIYK